jgi:predicted nucleic acid-binding protein
MKLVLDAGVVLRLLDEDRGLPAGHEFLAPTLMRSEVLESLYRSARSGDLDERAARAKLATYAAMKIRYLGDKVLRRRAWEIASELGWESTRTAEYVALTQLQAQAYVTLDEDLAADLASVVRLKEYESLA